MELDQLKSQYGALYEVAQAVTWGHAGNRLGRKAGFRHDSWQEFVWLAASVLQRAADLMIALPARRAMGTDGFLALRDELFVALERHCSKAYTSEGRILLQKELRLTKRMIPRVFLGDSWRQELDRCVKQLENIVLPKTLDRGQTVLTNPHTGETVTLTQPASADELDFQKIPAGQPDLVALLEDTRAALEDVRMDSGCIEASALDGGIGAPGRHGSVGGGLDHEGQGVAPQGRVQVYGLSAHGPLAACC